MRLQTRSISPWPQFLLRPSASARVLVTYRVLLHKRQGRGAPQCRLDDGNGARRPQLYRRRNQTSPRTDAREGNSLPQTDPRPFCGGNLQSAAKKYPEYSYREAAPIPPIRVIQQTGWESDIIREFRQGKGTRRSTSEPDRLRHCTDPPNLEHALHAPNSTGVATRPLRRLAGSMTR